MDLEQVELIFRLLGGLFCGVILIVIFYGIWRGARRAAGRTAGRFSTWFSQSIFLILSSVGFFGLCYWLWRPLPINIYPTGRAFLTITGCLFYFPGLYLVFISRLALGKEYFVSSSFGARLFARHHLVTRGPYAMIRHPMYLGLWLASAGGLLLYRNWAFVFILCCFLTLGLRIQREEQVLAEEFGAAWQHYRERVPAILPLGAADSLRKLYPHWSPSQSALFELGLLFLPALPAYLWVWPSLHPEEQVLVQGLVYIYILFGGLWVGLRRWSWSQLGFNLRGLGLSLVCGFLILISRWMIILSIRWAAPRPILAWTGVIADVIFYIGFVGLVEEMIFRGLLFRLFEEWGGIRWAIWGSSLGFGLWHIFGQGLAAGLATFAIGLLFALIRWRAGGIVGLIFFHGLWDLESVFLVSDPRPELLDPLSVQFTDRVMIWGGTLLLMLVPLYLWFLHPLLTRQVHRFTHKSAG